MRRARKAEALYTRRQITRAHKLADLHGGAWYDFLDPKKNGVGKLYNTAKAGAINQIKDPDSIFRSKIIPYAAKAAEGLGGPFALAAKAATTANNVAGSVQRARKAKAEAQAAAAAEEAYRPDPAEYDAPPVGGGGFFKPKRAISPAMARRNMIVKAYKAHHGCSLGEASRAVKEQGLWR